MIREPLPLLFNTGAVILGLVYGYLPFMVLPLYATLEARPGATGCGGRSGCLTVGRDLASGRADQPSGYDRWFARSSSFPALARI